MKDFAAIDFETANQQRTSVCSVGIVIVRDAGVELLNMKDMVNLTYDRLHTNGQKELFPTFVNRGNNFLLDEGDHNLFVIKFKAKKAGKFNLTAKDGMLVDRNLGTVNF